MTHETVNYIEQLRNVDLSLSTELINSLGEIMNIDPWTPSTRSQIEKSIKWIHNPNKMRFQKLIAKVVKLAINSYVDSKSKKVSEIDDFDGIYKCDVGFFSLPNNLLFKSRKIRTMVKDAEDLLDSPFDHASFQTGTKPDHRILDKDFVRDMRRWGKDGFAEIDGIVSGKWDFVGNRAYHKQELQGMMLLWMYRNDDIGLTKDLQKFVERYPDKIWQYKPRPSVGPGPYSSFAEKPSQITRMYGDILYCENANPLADFRLAVASVRHRIIRGVNAK